MYKGRRWPAALLAYLLFAPPASAEPLGANYFQETHYDVGLRSVDVSIQGVSASGFGVHVTEQNGLIGRAILFIPTLIGLIQLGGDEKVTSTVEERDVNVDHVDSRGNVQYTTKRRVKVWTWSVRSLTPEERAQRDRNAQQQLESYQRLAKHPMHFDLLYLPNRDNGQVHGVRGSFLPLALGIGKHVELATGYTGARMVIDRRGSAGETMRPAKFRMRGMPLRLGVAPARWLVFTGELNVNILGFTRDDDEADYRSTARLTAAVSIPGVDRIFAKIGAERVGLGSGGVWHTFFEGGMRF